MVVKQMNKNIISIIVPVYNSEKYVEICLESLKKQTYMDLEILCIDDGSTDNSPNIIKQYCSIDKRFKYYRTENKGVSNARNVGFEKSNGEYILFVDSDDWIDPETCKVAINVLLTNNADVVMWPYIREYGDLSLKKKIFNNNIVFEGEKIETLRKALIGYVEKGLLKPDNMDALSTVWGKLYRKSIIKEVKFYDIKEIGSYEDGLYNIEVFENVKKLVYINCFFSHYRKNNSASLTSNYNSNLFKQRNKIYDLILQYIREKGLDSSYEIALNNRVVYEILYLGLNEMNRKANCISHILELKKIMNSNRYEKARKNFVYQSFQLHWRIFYKFAVHKNSFMLYIMLHVMQIIRKRRH